MPHHGLADATADFRDDGGLASQVGLHGCSWVDAARQHGVAGYLDDGANRWPAVHRPGVARLFAAAVERAPAGAALHGAGDEGIAFHQLAAVISDGLGIPARSVGPDEAEQHFGWLAHFAPSTSSGC